MYNLTILFGPSGTPWAFLFKNKEAAYNAFNTTKAACIGCHPCDITDEYGQIAAFMAGDIHGVLIEDTELGNEARIIRGLEQAKGQARAAKRAQSDPELAQMMRGSGPSVITPFANGGFRQ